MMIEAITRKPIHGPQYIEFWAGPTGLAFDHHARATEGLAAADIGHAVDAQQTARTVSIQANRAPRPVVLETATKDPNPGRQQGHRDRFLRKAIHRSALKVKTNPFPGLKWTLTLLFQPSS